MGKKYDSITDDHRSFIEAQKMYFCATAAAEGRVNLSPKGSDTLRVFSPTKVIWLNLTGSGNETAAHLLDDPPHDTHVLRIRRFSKNFASIRFSYSGLTTGRKVGKPL